MPCVQPFTIQNAAKSAVSDMQPKRMFSTADRASPSTMKTRAFTRSAQKPLTKRLAP